MIAFDLETFLIERPIGAPRAVCAQWCDRAPAHELDGSLELISFPVIKRLLERNERLIGHFIAYDFAVIMANYPDLIRTVFELYRDDQVEDTLSRQKLLDIASGRLKFHKKFTGYDLGAVAHRHGIEVDKSDPWRLRYGELAETPIELWPASAREYAIRDATAAYRVAEAQDALDRAWTERQGSPILHQAPARARADLALHLASIWGVRTDATRVCELAAATERRMMELRHELAGHGLVRATGVKNMAAAKARIEAAFRNNGKLPPATKKGIAKIEAGELVPEAVTGELVSTERDACILSGDEVMVKFADYSRGSTVVSRIRDLEHGAVLPLQPRYDSLLETGRTSSSKGEKKKKADRRPTDLIGTQIQNFPRALDKQTAKLMRELFGHDFGARETLVPREGNVFVLADYSSAELHTLAQVCIDLFGHSRLGELLNANMDVHMWLGCHAFGRGQTYETLPKGAKDLDPFSEWRQTAKPIVFGRPGGMGARKIVLYARKAYNVILTEGEAKRLIGVYESNVPELPEYFDYISSKVENRKTCTIRQLRSGRWRGGCSYSAAANSYFQGLCADGALAALFAVAMECYSDPCSPLYGFRVVAFVHDEIATEGPAERAHEAAIRLQEIMEREFNVYTPDVPTPAEPLITEVWSKKAKQKRDKETGRMTPWRPEWLKVQQAA